MIRVLLNKPAENFTSRGFDLSPDAKAKGLAVVTESFSFENVKAEENGYSYDLRVVRETRAAGETRGEAVDRTASQKMFEGAFDHIAKMLLERGIVMKNFPAYKETEVLFHSCGDGRTLSGENLSDSVLVKFTGPIRLAGKGDDIIAANDLIARMSEQDSERKKHLVARAIGDHTLFAGTYKVSLESLLEVPIPTARGSYGYVKVLSLKHVTIKELLEGGEIKRGDVMRGLADFADRTKKPECYGNLPTTDGIEEYIIDLPKKVRKSVLARCRRTPSNLNLYRSYYPEGIEWNTLKAEDYMESDLDLMIRLRATVFSTAQEEFVMRCMEKPELEEKVAKNAYLLGARYLWRILAGLHQCTPTDVLRSALDYARNAEVDLLYLRCLFEVKEYAGLTRSDYDRCLKLVGEEDFNGSIPAFLLRVGLVARVSDSELAAMLEKRQTNLLRMPLREAYEECNFAPGLAWIAQEKVRREARRDQIAKERVEDNERVVRYVRNRKKSSVCVVPDEVYFSDPEDGLRLISMSGKEIGRLQSNEKRVVLVRGRRYAYLIDVERVKRRSVLRMDVYEYDAGYIIGSGGLGLKALTEQLRELGCERLKGIKIDEHDDQEKF